MILDGVRVVELAAWVAGPGGGRRAGRLGRRRRQGRAAGRRPAARRLRRRRRRRAGRRPAVRARQPRQAQRRARPAQRRRARRRWTGCSATADVFVTNIRVAALERLGLDHRCGARAAPATWSTGSSPGTGWRAPTPTAPATTSARSGPARRWRRRSCPPGTLPPPIRSGFGDHVTGMTLAGGICGALFDRERTGRGHLVSTSLLRTGLYCAGVGPRRAAALRQAGEHARPRTRRRRRRSSTATPPPTAPGSGCSGWRPTGTGPACVAAIDRPDLAADERFATAPDASRALRRADRRARRRVRRAADGRVGRALRRPRRLVGADQHTPHRARRPPGRGVRRVRRDVRRDGDEPFRADRQPRSTSTTRSSARPRPDARRAHRRRPRRARLRRAPRSRSPGAITPVRQHTRLAQAVSTAVRPSSSIACSRILNFWTLPVTVIGNSSTNLT